MGNFGPLNFARPRNRKGFKSLEDQFEDEPSAWDCFCDGLRLIRPIGVESLVALSETTHSWNSEPQNIEQEISNDEVRNRFSQSF